MGFFKSKKGSIISDCFQSVDKIGNYGAGIMLEVSLYDTYLTISCIGGKQEITLNYNQITDVSYGAKTEIKEKNKSVIGRALGGGLLFGGVGAIVGAVSGTGTKEEKEIHFYFIISYTSQDGEDKFLQFEDTRLYKGSKLSKKLKELCNISNEIPSNIQL